VAAVASAAAYATELETEPTAVAADVRKIDSSYVTQATYMTQAARRALFL
tara:strand:- start:3219 stop:3368 length:150 start_codon:yes stop_codon:yes gene_type:complete